MRSAAVFVVYAGNNDLTCLPRPQLVYAGNDMTCLSTETSAEGDLGAPNQSTDTSGRGDPSAFEMCEKGSVIYSDEWSTYSSHHGMGYRHAALTPPELHV